MNLEEKLVWMKKNYSDPETKTATVSHVRLLLEEIEKRDKNIKRLEDLVISYKSMLSITIDQKKFSEELDKKLKELGL